MGLLNISNFWNFNGTIFFSFSALSSSFFIACYQILYLLLSDVTDSFYDVAIISSFLNFIEEYINFSFSSFVILFYSVKNGYSIFFLLLNNNFFASFEKFSSNSYNEFYVFSAISSLSYLTIFDLTSNSC